MRTEENVRTFVFEYVVVNSDSMVVIGTMYAAVGVEFRVFHSEPIRFSHADSILTNFDRQRKPRSKGANGEPSLPESKIQRVVKSAHHYRPDRYWAVRRADCQPRAAPPAYRF